MGLSNTAELFMALNLSARQLSTSVATNTAAAPNDGLRSYFCCVSLKYHFVFWHVLIPPILFGSFKVLWIHFIVFWGFLHGVLSYSCFSVLFCTSETPLKSFSSVTWTGKQIFSGAVNVVLCLRPRARLHTRMQGLAFISTPPTGLCSLRSSPVVRLSGTAQARPAH